MPQWSRPRVMVGDIVTYVGHLHSFPAIVVKIKPDDSADLVAFTADPTGATEGLLGVPYDPRGVHGYSWHVRQIR